jgi:hypothetical protein
MDSGDERRLLRLLERLTEAVERISPPPVVATAAPVETPKDLASAVKMRPRRLPDEPDDRGLTRGGTDPKEFWARKK